MTAKYYIYRNLHTNTFSVRYRGKVIAHPTNFIARNVQFKVNETGRQRVLEERRKKVHAFVVCDSWEEATTLTIRKALQVHYNPYFNEAFMFAGSPINRFPKAIGAGGQNIYLAYTNKRKYT
jgi:hypothetical protein